MPKKSPKRPWVWVGFAVTLFATVGLAGRASGVLVDMAGHWSASIVAALQARGILSGDPSGQFEPDALLTRAQMAKLIVNSMGNGSDAALLSHYASRFTDIPDSYWAKGYVESLAESAVAEGYPDGTFGPDDPVTRAQVAAILVRAAGMTEEARQSRAAATGYTDDAEIPDWARGAVHVALEHGLMAGFPDGTFRPEQPITRAEGAVALFRLMGLKGTAYNLTGTLVRFDPITLQGTVRDDLGQETAFTMAKDAEYYRAGVMVSQVQVRTLDQVWIVLGPDGRGQFIDARYSDLLATDAQVSGQTVTVLVESGNRKTLPVEPGALIFLNGRQVKLSQLDGVPQIFLELDRVTGAARILDGVKTTIEGPLSTLDAGKRILFIGGANPQALNVNADAVTLLNGQRVPLDALQADDQLKMALDEAGHVTYLQAER